MKYNRCGKSGLKLSAFSLGLWHNFGSCDNYDNMIDMLAAHLLSKDELYIGCKGEYNGKERIFSVDIEPGGYEHLILVEVLPTGNPGGMKNSFKVTSK